MKRIKSTYFYPKCRPNQKEDNPKNETLSVYSSFEQTRKVGTHTLSVTKNSYFVNVNKTIVWTREDSLAHTQYHHFLRMSQCSFFAQYLQNEKNRRNTLLVKSTSKSRSAFHISRGISCQTVGDVLLHPRSNNIQYRLPTGYILDCKACNRF
jgi:hypothetical protein